MGWHISCRPKLYSDVATEVVDNIVYRTLRLTVFVSKYIHTIHGLVVLFLHFAELFVYLEIVDVVHANLIVFQDLKQAGVALNQFVAVHIGLIIV